MSLQREDSRSKKIIFVSSCLLNTNNKVRDLARYGGFSLDVVKILHKYDLGMQQMDCPETLYLGIQRWQHTKNLYDNVGFRRFDFCHRGAVVTKRVGAGDIVQDKRAGKSADKVAGKLRQNIVIRGASGIIYARRGFAEADKPF